jgi:chromosome segregation ATPase
MAERDQMREDRDEAHRSAGEAQSGRKAVEGERDRIAKHAADLAQALETAQAELNTLRSKVSSLEVSSKDAEDARRRVQDLDAERRRTLDSLKQAEGDRDSAELAQARAASELAQTQRRAEDVTRERDQALAQARQASSERDAITQKLKEREEWVDQLAEAVTQQRDALAAMSAERDQARSSADQARKIIDELTGQMRSVSPGAASGSYAGGYS